MRNIYITTLMALTHSIPFKQLSDSGFNAKTIKRQKSNKLSKSKCFFHLVLWRNFAVYRILENHNIDEISLSPYSCSSNTVIPIQGAAAHKGAVKRCAGYRQILNLLPFIVFHCLRHPILSLLVS